MDILDTIYGEMTFPGRSALRVVRVSGELTKKAVEKIFDRHSSLMKTHKTAVRGKLLDLKGNTIDDIVAIFFKKPNSYTGEDVVEFHCHGVETVLKILSSSLESFGIRKAKNGEFSFRAFINGKISLKEARRLKKVMEAQTLKESSAVYASQEIIERELKSLSETIIEILARWEARIDFPEEVPQEDINKWIEELSPLQKQIDHLLKISERSRQVKEGFKVAIFGAPNSGKSSLFNNLLGRERAIVTPHPGTTRDILEEKLEIDGLPVIFLDMAGARKKSQKIEKAGIEKAIKVAEGAHLVLFLFDGKKGWRKSDDEALSFLKGKKIIKVATKKDLYKKKSLPENVVEISNLSGFGIEKLIKMVISSLKASLPKGDLLILDEREMMTVQKTARFVKDAFISIKQRDEVYASDFLKRALFEIDELFKTESLEIIYDSIFKDFCIGK
ncbi:MAG: tRNA uridine-5-carboxymethylaminomethyl(34) synthesis GTPase MnmE [Acidobacteriota bacterium]